MRSLIDSLQPRRLAFSPDIRREAVKELKQFKTVYGPKKLTLHGAKVEVWVAGVPWHYKHLGAAYDAADHGFMRVKLHGVSGRLPGAEYDADGNITGIAKTWGKGLTWAAFVVARDAKSLELLQSNLRAKFRRDLYRQRDKLPVPDDFKSGMGRMSK